MRRTVGHTILLVLCVSVVGACGCSRNGNGGSNRVPVSQKKREALQKATALPLPRDVCLVASGDGGGRDPSYGFYTWTFYSKSGITFVPSQMVKYDPQWWNTPNIVEIIKVDVPELNIEGKHSSSTAEWVSGGYRYSGVLLMTAQGDYLNIERFRHHVAAPTSHPTTAGSYKAGGGHGGSG